jgi:hypothetical protein
MTPIVGEGERETFGAVVVLGASAFAQQLRASQSTGSFRLTSDCPSIVSVSYLTAATPAHAATGLMFRDMYTGILFLPLIGMYST